MERLGLWGEGTAFTNFDAFFTAMDKRGLCVLELLAVELKARGSYLCRSLDYAGAHALACIWSLCQYALVMCCWMLRSQILNPSSLLATACTFEVVEAPLAAPMIEHYEAAVHYWQLCRMKFANAAKQARSSSVHLVCELLRSRAYMLQRRSAPS